MRYLVLVLLFMSCATKKKYTDKQVKSIIDSVKVNSKVIQIDTIKEYKERIVTKPINTIIEVPIECDKDGKIKDLQYQVNSGNNRIKAILKGNKLLLESELDSATNVIERVLEARHKKQIDSIIKSHSVKDIKHTEKEVVKKPFWSVFEVWIYRFIIIVLIILLLRNKILNLF